MNNQIFTQKVVWITGASSGIGEALACEFAARGAEIILSGRNVKELERVSKRCSEFGREGFIVPLDLTVTESINNAAQQVLVKYGTVHYLVNNGGISQRGKVAETALEVDRRIMEVNYFGAITLTKLVLPAMLEHGGGHIVVLSSVVGKIGFPVRSAYAASKHALHGFFETLWAEYHTQGISVNLICPGMVRTNISIHALESNGKEHGVMDDRQAKGITPERCAQIIIRSIRKNKHETYIGKEQILIYLKRYCPWIFYRIVSKFKPV